MSVIDKSFSAVGKLVSVGILLGAFLTGMAGVVYMSLSGSELKVPELVGKDFVESEKELAALGLKIKRRADRVSTDPINTVIEQLPKPGETVKTGQMILVVVSKASLAGEEAPSSLKKNLEEDDLKKIEDMISDKPKKKTNSNTNKKKVETTRDVIAGDSSSNTATDSTKSTDVKSDDSVKKDPIDRSKETPAGTAPKPQNTPAAKPNSDQRPKP